MGNHLDKRAATNGGTRFHRSDRLWQQLPLRTDSIPRRSDTICAGSRDVRPARQPAVPRVPTRKNTDEPGSCTRNRKESSLQDSLATLACQGRATTSRWTRTMVSERTPHEECGSANRLRRRTRVTCCGTEVNDDGNIEGRDGIATSLRGIIAR